MSSPTDRAIIDRWREEPAPLLPMLHAFHDRDGYLSDDALRCVAQALRMPLADLFGTVTFYHHFARHAARTQHAPRVCTGPICARHGSHALLTALAEQGATPMPCAGRCDEPIPVLRGHEALVGRADGTLTTRPTPLPPPNPGGIEECVFHAIREPDRATLAGYRRTHGYTALTRAVTEMTPREVIDFVRASGLAGRGGAGFPTGVKWQAVADAAGTPKTVVCNADEGEPGCFKDRAVMDYDPHAVIEGLAMRRTPRARAGASSTCATSIPTPRHFAARRGRGARPICWGRTSWARASPSTSTSAGGAVPTSAARRRRCSTAWRASIPSRATGRPTRSPTASKTCPPRSTTWRRWPPCPRSCAAVRNGTKAWGWASLPAPRWSASRATCSDQATTKYPSASPCARCSTTGPAVPRRGAPSRP
ncbi:MAG: NAD(P)H-dependent oxidoreductase subunit E [Caldilineaceae bacterium]